MDTEYTVWRKRADSIVWELWLAPVARETDAIRVMESEAKASPTDTFIVRRSEVIDAIAPKKES